jgi:hypothetical protein
MKRQVTSAEIEAAQTPNGGWTRAQLAVWGVPWPPPRGWKKRLTKWEPKQKIRRAPAASWRSDPVTPKQRVWLVNLGIPVPQTKGEAADLIAEQLKK